MEIHMPTHTLQYIYIYSPIVGAYTSWLQPQDYGALQLHLQPMWRWHPVDRQRTQRSYGGSSSCRYNVWWTWYENQRMTFVILGNHLMHAWDFWILDGFCRYWLENCIKRYEMSILFVSKTGVNSGYPPLQVRRRLDPFGFLEDLRTFQIQFIACESSTGWWLVVWNILYFSIFVGNNHLNWRTHLFQRGRVQPPTSQSWDPPRKYRKSNIGG